jgi:hypothetical protein
LRALRWSSSLEVAPLAALFAAGRLASSDTRPERPDRATARSASSARPDDDEDEDALDAQLADAQLADEDLAARRDENLAFAQRFTAAHRATFERLGQ